MNIWGYKKKAKVYLELERFWESQVRRKGEYARKKMSQLKGAREYCLKMIRTLKK